ncbi:class I SAM-dependent methyltransferase [Candidatus Roizmanbacteria bacterium]|nr:class I SAM-dependent methyltransferase [Candidatus Roizmanbacteria bacterium]
MYVYSKQNAKIYSQLSVIGTTYEVYFNEVKNILGNLSGKKILDFGTGAGRSAQLIKTLNAREVVGVDHNKEMIELAKKIKDKSIKFHLISNKIPYPDSYFDEIICIAVLIEMGNKKEMNNAFKEIYRVLKPGRRLVVTTTNPKSIGYDYVSYRYESKNNLKSGDRVTCIVKGKKPFKIDDYFWEEKDYKEILKQTGFKIKKISYPLGIGDEWLDETKMAPELVITAVK